MGRLHVYLPAWLEDRWKAEAPADVSASKVCQDALVAKLDEVSAAARRDPSPAGGSDR